MAHVYKFMFYSFVELNSKINTRSLFNRALNPAHPTLPSGPLLALSVFIGAGQPLQHGEVRDTNLAWVGPVGVRYPQVYTIQSWNPSSQLITDLFEELANGPNTQSYLGHGTDYHNI